MNCRSCKLYQNEVSIHTRTNGLHKKHNMNIITLQSKYIHSEGDRAALLHCCYGRTGVRYPLLSGQGIDMCPARTHPCFCSTSSLSYLQIAQHTQASASWSNKSMRQPPWLLLRILRPPFPKISNLLFLMHARGCICT